ncbi:MAG: diacylglycerol kinase family lipid kinase [Bacillota bacterium]|nr:diacylglycerol kinase family lipid kinase [Bacillota bacterium]
MGQGVAGKRLFFIINRQAGSGRVASWWREFEPQLQQAGWDYFYEYTVQGEVARQVRRAVVERGAQAVVAVGGDGSLYEALGGLIENDALIEPQPVFVAYPAGSACDFVRSLGYTDGGCELLRLLEHGQTRHIDVGRCAYHGADGAQRTGYFINGFDAGAGADTCALVNADQGELKKRHKSGKLAFKRAAMQVLMRFSYTRTEVEADGQRFSGEYIIIGAGNGRYIGGSMLMFPQAALDDGKLDLLLVGRRSFISVLSVFSRVYSGGHLQIKNVDYLHAREIAINSARPLAIELDGEVPGTTPVRLTVLPQLLPVLFPA